MAVKRTRTYATVHGIMVGGDGSTEITDVLVDSRCRKTEVIERRARKEHPNFVPMPNGVKFYEQECVMDDATFYAHCDFGEATEVTPNGDAEETPTE